MTGYVDQFAVEASMVAIKRMFSGERFDICTVRDTLKACRISPIESQIDTLRVLHCVRFSEMPPSLREQLLQRTMALFTEGFSGFDMSVIERGFMAQQQPDIGRVISEQSSPQKKRSFLGLTSK